MDLTKMSAYGGGTWSERDVSSKDEKLFNTEVFGINSEYSKLRAVTLHVPLDDFNISNPEHFQMLEKPTTYTLAKQLKDYGIALSRMGIEVNYIDANIFHPNLVFTRDTYAMTPYGAIIGRPASFVRAGEEVDACETLVKTGVPVLFTMHDKMLFEGADFLWVSKEDVFLGINRTNMRAAHALVSLMQFQGVRVHVFELDKPASQHLLDACVIISEDTVLVRPAKAPDNLIEGLKSFDYNVVRIDEVDEVVHKQAMSLVVTEPGHIVMPKDCPFMTDTYKKLSAVKHIEHVDISEVRKMAGGLAGVTGIMKRDLV